jgi:hypothetical protein
MSFRLFEVEHIEAKALAPVRVSILETKQSSLGLENTDWG